MGEQDSSSESSLLEVSPLSSADFIILMPLLLSLDLIPLSLLPELRGIFAKISTVSPYNCLEVFIKSYI